VARVAGAKFDTDEGVELLQNVVIDLAGEFAAEVNVDVVGIAVHRENDTDLHVHLIFSPSREVALEKRLLAKATAAAVAKQIATELATERQEKGLPPLGRNRLRELARQKMKAQKLNMECSIERQRRRFPRPIQILGPSFRGKLAVWEASGRDEEIAQIGDRPLGESNTFRERISGAILSGEDLTKQFIDLWLERCFERKIRAVLNGDDLREIDTLAAQSVANYRKTRSVTPCVEDYIAAQMNSMVTSLPTEISKDLEQRARELDDREKTICQREQELAGALVITDDVWKEFKVPKSRNARAVLLSLASARDKAEKRLTSIHNVIGTWVKIGRTMVGENAWKILEALKKILEPTPKKAREAPTREM
jgi:hypothetical protein